MEREHWSPGQWKRVNDLFEQAVEAHPDNQNAILENEAAPAIAAEVRRLLAHHNRSTGVLDRGFGGAAIARRALESGVLKAGDVLLGRFRIIAKIGEGGMGEVYDAEDLDLNVHVAVKTIRQEIAQIPKVLARFKQEIQLSRRVTHPNVCRIFDLARDGELTFLTMELLTGETLAQKLKREGPFSEETALPIVRQILDALAAAHDANIVHRDLKSNNIMLDQGRTVVMDFGLSRSLSDPDGGVSNTGFPAGTPAYMAPEQIECAELGPYTDIYALGVILFEMMTGAQPFDGASPMAQAMKRVKESPKNPRAICPGLSERWERVILRCLAYKQADRFQSARDVMAVLEGKVELEPLPVQSPYNKRWLIGGMAATVALCAAGFVATREPEPSPQAKRWFDQGVNSLHDGLYETARKQLEFAVKQDPGFAKIHARLAEVHVELDASDKAREEALLASSATGGRWFASSPERKYFEGVRALALRDMDRAVTFFEQRAAAVPELEKTEALIDLARISDRAEKPDKAVPAYEDVLKRDPSNPVAHLRLAVIIGRRKGLAAAVHHFEEAAKGYELRNNNEGRSEVAFQLAMLLRQQDLAKSESEFRKALNLAADSPAQRVKTLYQLCVVQRRRGDDDDAAATVATAIQLARDSNLENLAAQGLIEQGSLLLVKRNYPEAEMHFRSALTEFRRLKGRRSEARALASLASVLKEEDKLDEAAAAASEALSFYKAGSYSSRELDVSMVLASIQEARLDRLPEAVKTYQELSIRAQAANDKAAALLADLRGADLLWRQSRLTEAVSLFRRAVDTANDTGEMPRLLGAKLALAGVQTDLGEFAASSALLDQAETIAMKLGGDDVDRVALERVFSAISRESPADAAMHLPALKRLIEGKNRPRAAQAKVAMGFTRALQGDSAQAIRLCMEGLALAEKINDPFLAARTHSFMSRIFFRAGRWARAVAEANTAVAAYDRVGRFDDVLIPVLILSVAETRLGNQAAAVSARMRSQEIQASERKLWGDRAMETYLKRPDIAGILKVKGD